MYTTIKAIQRTRGLGKPVSLSGSGRRVIRKVRIWIEALYE